jgi:hypothetical protein
MMYAAIVLGCFAWVLDPSSVVQSCVDQAGYVSYKVAEASAGVECETDQECVDGEFTAFLSYYVAQGR